MYIYVYIYISLCIHIYIYIHIYIERDREREREKLREKSVQSEGVYYIILPINFEVAAASISRSNSSYGGICPSYRTTGYSFPSSALGAVSGVSLSVTCTQGMTSSSQLTV